MERFDVVRKSQESALVAATDAALTDAVLQTGLRPDQGIYAIDGMSGLKYRYFINRLIGALPDARYLEIGSFTGSTLCAAIYGNRVRAVAIDNFSQFGGPKGRFVDNVTAFRTPEAEVTFLEADFRAVDYTLMNSYNVYFFDGPHTSKDQYDGLAMALPCLDPEFVFIVDDWNWDQVRRGTAEALSRCGMNILYMAEIRTSLNDHHPKVGGKASDWHNGYMISVLGKA